MMKKIGKIVNTKGLKGEIKVLSSSDFKQIRFKKNNILYIKKDNEYIPLTVHNWYAHKNFDIIKFKEYNYIDEVEKILNLDLYGEKLDDSILNDDEYFFEQLVGFKVYENDNLIGEVTEVLDQANKTYLRIKKVNNKKIYFPFVKEFLQKVEKSNEKIYINSIEGLLDD